VGERFVVRARVRPKHRQLESALAGRSTMTGHGVAAQFGQPRHHVAQKRRALTRRRNITLRRDRIIRNK
jgi:hypothetical protein